MKPQRVIADAGQHAAGPSTPDVLNGLRASAACLLALVFVASPWVVARGPASSSAPDVALRLAIADRDLAEMARAVRAGAQVDGRYPSGTSPLAEAVGPGDAGPVRWLVEHGADVNGKVSTGVPPLFFALNGRSPAVLQILLEAGADVGASLPGGRTPLHAACLYGDESRVLAVVDALLAAGADPNAADARGVLPLACAAETGHARVVGRLVRAGAE